MLVNNDTTKKIVNNIKKYLTEKGVFEDSDLMLIEELVYSFSIAQEAKKLINELGILAESATGEVKVSPSITIYNSAVKNILQISRKLGISPRDRHELKLTLEEQDGFDE